MISHSKKFIFIRTAKTASTSILEILNEYGIENIEIKDYEYDPNHLSSKHIKECVGNKIFYSYFKFSFVRNPFSRIVSMWMMNKDYHKDTPNFRNYVKSIPTLEWMPNQGNHPRPPREVWLKKYSSMYNYTKECDFIGKLENLQQDFNIICDKIGIPQQVIPHENSTKHKHYTEYYDDATKQIVAEKYAKDIEYFGYEFGK
jgi:chondroitin 4-sulfotransferase 11